MKTQGEIEAAICERINRFEQEYMGRSPKDIHAHLIGDLLVVRLRGVLILAEQQLVKTLRADTGKRLLKQVRTQLMQTARPTLETMVQAVTGAKVVSLHHDISTVTGEEGVPFTLASPLSGLACGFFAKGAKTAIGSVTSKDTTTPKDTTKNWTWKPANGSTGAQGPAGSELQISAV